MTWERNTGVYLGLQLIAREVAEQPDVLGRPPHELGTVVWAWHEEGLGIWALADDIAKPGERDATLERLNESIKYRPRRLMRAEARGLVAALRAFTALELLNEQTYSIARYGGGIVTSIRAYEADDALVHLRGKPGHGIQMLVQKLIDAGKAAA